MGCTGSSKHIGTLDFDLTSNNQTMDSTIGWFPLESDRGELRIGWRTYPLSDLLALPNQLNELRASHAAEVRRLEVSVAEAEGRAQAAEKRAQVRDAAIAKFAVHPQDSFMTIFSDRRCKPRAPVARARWTRSPLTTAGRRSRTRL